MNKDVVVIGICVGTIIILNFFLGSAVGLQIFPVIYPSFCFNSILPRACMNIWSVLEMLCIVIVVYFVFGRKRRERIHD